MLCLRDALAFFETVFVARDAVFAARPRTSLPPRDLDALDLDGAVFAGVLLRAAPVLDTVFLEAAGFCFLEAAVLFAGGRPRALIPRPDLEAVLFGDLAMHDSFELESSAPIRSNSNRGATARVPIGGEPHSIASPFALRIAASAAREPNCLREPLFDEELSRAGRSDVKRSGASGVSRYKSI